MARSRRPACEGRATLHELARQVASIRHGRPQHDREQRQLYRRSERRSSDRLHPLELMSPSTQRRALDGGVDELELRDGAMDAARCPLVEPPEEEAPGNLPELAVQRQLREKYDVGSEVTALESGPT